MILFYFMLKSIYKEHNSKSIHNFIGGGVFANVVEINIQRTQFKINSQRTNPGDSVTIS